MYGLGLCIVCDNLDMFSAVKAGSSSRVCSRHIMAGKHRVYKLLLDTGLCKRSNLVLLIYPKTINF